jgi:Flp pilus assembly protein TadG
MRVRNDMGSKRLHLPRKKKNTSRGQGFVEFAVILPVMLTMIMGIVEFGRLAATYAAVASASREAARYGAAVGNSGFGTVDRYKDCIGIRDAALRIASGFTEVQYSDISIEYDTGPGTAVYAACEPPLGMVQLGHRIIVKVEATYQPIFSLGLEPFTISSEAKRTIVKEVELN